MPAKVWQPGVDKLEEGEELQCDPSAYNSLHAFHIGWACLRQKKLLGTLLEYLKYLTFKCELVPAKAADDDSNMDSEDSDSDDDSEDEEFVGSGAPVLQLRKVGPEGCVDRIRAMTQNPHIRVSWADTGHVQVILYV